MHFHHSNKLCSLAKFLNFTVLYVYCTLLFCFSADRPPGLAMYAACNFPPMIMIIIYNCYYYGYESMKDNHTFAVWSWKIFSGKTYVVSKIESHETFPLEHFIDIINGYK